MAKIIPTSLVESISGKTCRHDDTYFATNKQTGQVYAVRYCNTSTEHLTEAQLGVQKSFKTRAQFASKWWSANKPKTAKDSGTDAYQLIKKAYKSQHKCGNIYAYMCTLITNDFKVKIGDIDLTGGIVAGGGSSSGTSKPSEGSGGDLEG